MTLKYPTILAVLITAVLSALLTEFIDQKRWEAHERQQKADAQQEMIRIEDQVRAMHIRRPQ